MNNFNPSGYLNRLVANIINNQVKPQNTFKTGGDFSASIMSNTPQTQQKQTLSPELKMTRMEVEETARYVKELLNMPKEITQVISQMVSTNTYKRTEYAASFAFIKRKNRFKRTGTASGR